MGSMRRRLERLEGDHSAAFGESAASRAAREAVLTAYFYTMEDAGRRIRDEPRREPTEEERAALEVDYEPAKPPWVSERAWAAREDRFQRLYEELEERRSAIVNTERNHND